MRKEFPLKEAGEVFFFFASAHEVLEREDVRSRDAREVDATDGVNNDDGGEAGGEALDLDEGEVRVDPVLERER